MANVSPTFKPGDVTITGATTPTIYNIASPATANTEFSQALPTGTKMLTLRCRTAANMKVAFVSGESGSNYITIPGLSSYSVDQLSLTGKTLYMQVDQSSVTIELLVWN